MFGESVIKELVQAFLEKLREVESIKGPYVVHGYNMLKIAAIGERAKHGLPVMEPYGSSRKLPTFEELTFLPAMISRLPADPAQVQTETVIGKHAKKPLTIATPVMTSAMAYGLSLSRQAKIAWSMGSAMADTATNSGDAGFFDEDRKHAKYYIVQFNRARFGNSEEQLKQADAIEIRFGQGAHGALPETVDDADMDEELAKQLNARPGQSTTRPLLHPEIAEGKTLKDMVRLVREINPEVPVGVKIACGRLEEDLDIIADAGADFVTIDGAGGGTANSPEVTLNNLGIPLVYAIPRAHRHLARIGARDRIDIIATGGLRDAGDFLKALALGADAVYTGESALIAMVYSQLHKIPLPNSPAELYLSWGKYGDKLDIDEAARSLANFIQASTKEMAILAAMTGKQALKDVNTDDLAAISEEMSKATGVKTAF